MQASVLWSKRAMNVVHRQALSAAETVPHSVGVPQLHPAMLTPGIRRLSSGPYTSYYYSQSWRNGVSFQRVLNVKTMLERLARWKKNFARLYARRMLEIAALAMASRRFVTEMDAALDKPDAWANWSHRDWTDDLVAALGSNKFERFCTATVRLFNLGLLASPLLVLIPLSHISETVRSYTWKYALWGIEEAGPTFTKLTQWATTRQDLFSQEFCQNLGTLRDQTQGHSWETSQEVLQAELGSNVLSQYIEMDPQCIGSGCIAQVYKGTLKQGVGQFPAGTELAIKIQHPNVWNKVCADCYILGKFSKFLENLPWLHLEYLSLYDTVRQFRDVMLPQLDLTLEAKHLARFNKDFASDDNVTFPRALNELTTEKVLVETFLYGTPIMEYEKAPKPMREAVARLGLETTLKMIFLNDFIHGDLHPGNILVHEREDGRPQLNFLDCGLVLEMGPDQHVNMIKILGAFTRKDGRLAGQLMVDTSNKCQASALDVEMFIAGIQGIIIHDDEQNFIENVGDYIADICYLACKHRVKLEGAFVNAALAVEIMEGIATALHREMYVQPIALKMIVQAELMHRLKTFL